jgi:hypothetical protein
VGTDAGRELGSVGVEGGMGVGADGGRAIGLSEHGQRGHGAHVATGPWEYKKNLSTHLVLLAITPVNKGPLCSAAQQSSILYGGVKERGVCPGTLKNLDCAAT